MTYFLMYNAGIYAREREQFHEIKSTQNDTDRAYSYQKQFIAISTRGNNKSNIYWPFN